MADFDHCDFETPNGWRTYIVREYSVPNFSFPLGAVRRIGKNDLSELGNFVEVEDWGHERDDPIFEIGLRRTLSGWVEGWREEVGGLNFEPVDS